MVRLAQTLGVAIRAPASTRCRLNHQSLEFAMFQQGLVIFSKNKKRVAAFYQQVLELEMVESENSHDLLRGHGYEIVVHSIPRKIAASISIERPPSLREDAVFKPTFVVNSLQAAKAAAERTGGHLKPEEAAWRFRGCVVLDGWDPEGNIVQFKQVE